MLPRIIYCIYFVSYASLFCMNPAQEIILHDQTAEKEIVLEGKHYLSRTTIKTILIPLLVEQLQPINWADVKELKTRLQQSLLQEDKEQLFKNYYSYSFRLILDDDYLTSEQKSTAAKMGTQVDIEEWFWSHKQKAFPIMRTIVNSLEDALNNDACGEDFSWSDELGINKITPPSPRTLKKNRLTSLETIKKMFLDDSVCSTK